MLFSHLRHCQGDLGVEGTCLDAVPRPDDLLVSRRGKPLRVLKAIHGPSCECTDGVKYGQTSDGKQRFHCRNPLCTRQTFLIKYVYKGRLPEIKEPIVDRTMHGSGVRDIARVLPMSPTTVMET